MIIHRRNTATKKSVLQERSGWRMSAFSPLSGNEQTSGERAKMTAFAEGFG
jgi:hypothetical protein